jgi:hypothetical protein
MVIAASLTLNFMHLTLIFNEPGGSLAQPEFKCTFA